MIKEVTYKEPSGYFNEAMRAAAREYDRKHGIDTGISYEDALEIAREHKDNIDNCIEYENGYVFGAHKDSYSIGGYGHTPVVILKEDGSVIRMPEFKDIGTGEELRSFDI